MENKEQKESDSYYNIDFDPVIGKVFFLKYKIIKRLGEGAFGKVYKAEYNGINFAVKVEERTDNDGILEKEATIMNYLKCPNIPYVKTFGYSGKYNVLVMQLLGRSLEDILNQYSKFSIKTTSMLGYQMVGILQYIHERHIIHRDIKPDNFAMGAEELNAYLYLLDFGLAKKYRSSKTLEQIPLVNNKKLTGTARYASIHALEGFEQSRRDDLESLGYVLIYFLKGNLPWQGLRVKTKEEKYRKILEKKKEISSEELGKDFPQQFSEFLDYTKKLEYKDAPDYDMLKNKLLSILNEKGYIWDFIYDWTNDDDLKIRNNAVNKENEVNANQDKKLTGFNDININKDNNINEGNNINGGNNNIEAQRNNQNDKVESGCCLM